MYLASFLFLLFLIPIISSADAETIRAYLLAPGETSFANDEIKLEANETFDVSNDVQTLDSTQTETIGNIEVELVLEIKLVADDKDSITLENTDLETVTVEIPDDTVILAPATWNREISPPTEINVPTDDAAPSGFQTPTRSIQVGSPDVVLFFDSPVTIILEGVTGQTAFKLSGTTQWVLINPCLGTFENPTDPGSPSECSITDGTDTKILTYHFTEFAALSESGINRSGGSGGGDRTKPSLQSNIISSLDSQIHGGVLKLDDSARENTSIFETGDTIDVELTFYENSGTESLQHVTLFTNIRGHEDRYKSDLYVEWNKNKPIKVHDPENFLNRTAAVSYTEENNNVVMIFHLNFIKPMDTSHIILNYWDYKRNSGLETFEDSILIIEPVELIFEEPLSENTVVDNLNILQQKEEIKHVPSWVKKNAGWWSDGQLEDEVFTNGLQYLIQKKIIDIPILSDASNRSNEEIISNESKMPSWIKNNAKWWSEDMISDEDFVNAVKWMIASGIIVI